MTAAHLVRKGGKRIRPSKHKAPAPKAENESGAYFCELIYAPSKKHKTGWPPGFTSVGNWSSTSSAQSKAGTKMNEANKGHAAHGAKPDGALKSRPAKRRAK